MIQIKFSGQINVAICDTFIPALKAGFFIITSFMEVVRENVENDQAYTFMDSIKGTPTCWKKFQSEVLPMVEQLCVPIFFPTLSCADLRWD